MVLGLKVLSRLEDKVGDRALLGSGNSKRASAPTVLPGKLQSAAKPNGALLNSGNNKKATAPTVIPAPKPRPGNGVAGPTK